MMDKFKELLKGLSLEEKAKLCVGKNYWQTYDVKEIDLPSLFMCDGPSGLRKQDILNKGEDVLHREKDNLHIEKDNLDQEKAGGNLTTTSVCFPSGSAVASSWDKELLRQIGYSLGKKAASENVDILLAPSMNIKRNPLCGRNFEYYSEDPLLSGELAAGFIDGVQENHVAACPKHFALNNQETKRKAINVIIGERALREIYLKNFQIALKKGKPWTIMSAYSRINGEFPAQNHHILNEILREEWGFDGVIISDWGAIDQIVPSVKEGFNLQMPGDGGYSAEKIVTAVKNGELAKEKLDQAVIRMLQLANLTVKQRKEESENKENKDSKDNKDCKDSKDSKDCKDCKNSKDIISNINDIDNVENRSRITDEELHQKAYEAAAESIILLKNKDHILPLQAEDKLLIIGDMAVNPRYQVGGGSAAVQSYQVDQPLNFIRKLSPGAEYAKGYSSQGYSGEKEMKELLKEAADKSAKADKVIIFAGLPGSYESEGIDRQKLDLPEDQNRLIHELSKYNSNIIIVLANGSAVTMPWLSGVKAVLECYLGGEAVGRAVADIMFGIKNPCGKLAETFPVRLEDTPSFLSFPGDNNTVEYQEGIFVGYRYYEKKMIKPLFAFGYGLSYTKFTYSDMYLNFRKLPEKEKLAISVNITNTGDCYGKEVVQLYLGKKDSRVMRPVKELKAFDKLGLKPKETATVIFVLDKKDFSYYNSAVGDWVAEPGLYQIYLGSSSQDIRLRTEVELLSNDKVLLPITRNTAFGDIFDNLELNDIFMPFFETFVENIPLEFNLGDKNGDLAKAMLRGMTFHSIESYEGAAAGDEVIEDIICRLNKKLNI